MTGLPDEGRATKMVERARADRVDAHTSCLANALEWAFADPTFRAAVVAAVVRESSEIFPLHWVVEVNPSGYPQASSEIGFWRADGFKDAPVWYSTTQRWHDEDHLFAIHHGRNLLTDFMALSTTPAASAAGGSEK